MNSFNKRTLQGTLLFSGLFLGLCLLVVLLLPAKAQDDTGKVSEFNSFSNLGTLITEDFFSDSSFKTDYSDDYSPEATEEFRQILMTMRPEEVPAWVRSLAVREVEIPAGLRDEVLLIVSELRNK